MKKIIIIICLIFWPLGIFLHPAKVNFPPQTIFTDDYQAKQKILRDTKLYKTVFMARLFHNKARIVLDKFNSNLFALTDPNNYFFGFAPRQIVENQNLQKYPFVALPFFFWGIWTINKHLKKILIISSLLFLILGLSFLTNFDRYDFVLWVPFSTIIIHGVTNWPKKFNFYFILFLFLAIPEIMRLFI